MAVARSPAALLHCCKQHWFWRSVSCMLAASLRGRRRPRRGHSIPPTYHFAEHCAHFCVLSTWAASFKYGKQLAQPFVRACVVVCQQVHRELAVLCCAAACLALRSMAVCAPGVRGGQGSLSFGRLSDL